LFGHLCAKGEGCREGDRRQVTTLSLISGWPVVIILSLLHFAKCHFILECFSAVSLPSRKLCFSLDSSLFIFLTFTRALKSFVPAKTREQTSGAELHTSIACGDRRQLTWRLGSGEREGGGESEGEAERKRIKTLPASWRLRHFWMHTTGGFNYNNRCISLSFSLSSGPCLQLALLQKNWRFELRHLKRRKKQREDYYRADSCAEVY